LNPEQKAANAGRGVARGCVNLVDVDAEAGAVVALVCGTTGVGPADAKNVVALPPLEK
jgi:hypothetical protein